nr:MAG TPA: hypothetical protein [Caudoviricetes sp.]
MRGQPHFPNLHAILAPKTRSGRYEGGGGLSPGVAGVCFSSLGQLGVVVFGVCAGRGVECCLCSCCLCCCVVVV